MPQVLGCRIAVRSRSSLALAVTTSTLSPRGALWKHALITSSFSGRSGMLATRHAPPSHLAPPPARRLPRSRRAGGRCPPPLPPCPLAPRIRVRHAACASRGSLAPHAIAGALLVRPKTVGH
ncbi:hypothetical protein IEO21_06451 [Rhodonia placenta]|uniref:Uncharacterized protein n=1 Tax=Rhodonia placenta TaxID=104341 RepID=A0A8H7U1B0_9APHY|nr:hypothetical protein IEO21_06451 [Postia placenta]